MIIWYLERAISTRARHMAQKSTLLTLDVPEAGRRYFGLSRNGSYAAAARGELPTVKVGRLIRVPVRAMDLMLEKAGVAAGLPDANKRAEEGRHHMPTAQSLAFSTPSASEVGIEIG